ncbi:MAG TPA: ABC transporter permease [Thermoplasmata archaeon]|nr:ABC transporter permease [Thermoplasmata archaeon]
MVRLEKSLERWTRKLLSFNPILADKAGLSAREFGKTTDLFLKTGMGKVGIVIIAFFLAIVVYAELFVPYDRSGSTDDISEFESWEHPFGTDGLGRDVLVRTLHGTKASLTVGFVAMAISMGMGTAVGLVSGFWGGWKDEVIMRLNDVFLSIPWLVLMMVIVALFQTRSLSAIIIVIGVTGWSTTARIVRSQVLSLKARQFVERARAIGASDGHIIRKHIFPNVVPLVFANAILTIAIAILSESTLSFLGLGPQDVETWGKVLEDAYVESAALGGQYAYVIMPGLCIVIVVLGFTFVGYAMDEVLNPKLRQR